MYQFHSNIAAPLMIVEVISTINSHPKRRMLTGNTADSAEKLGDDYKVKSVS